MPDRSLGKRKSHTISAEYGSDHITDLSAVGRPAGQAYKRCRFLRSKQPTTYSEKRDKEADRRAKL